MVAVVSQIDAERLRQASGAVAEVARTAPPTFHQGFARCGTEGPDQDRAPDALGLADHVEQLMRSVGEIDVSDSGRAEDVAVAHRWPFVSVARWIFWPVRLRFDDHTRGETFSGVVGENAAEEIHRHVSWVSVVEGGLQNICGDACSPVRSVMRRDNSSRSGPASERMDDLSRGRTWPICTCNSRSSSVAPLSAPTISLRIVPSVRPATSGSGRPSTYTSVRRPLPRSSSMGTRATMLSALTYFPNPRVTIRSAITFISIQTPSYDSL